MNQQFIVAMAIGVALLATAHAVGQDNLGKTDDGSTATPMEAESTTARPAKNVQDDPAVSEKSFAQIISEVRANERKINEMFSSIPIGFPDQQKAHMEQIENLRTINLELKETLESAAVKTFQAGAKVNPRATLMVFSMMMRKLEGSPDGFVFDPHGALELADLMLKTDLDGGPIKFEEVAFQAFRASFAIQDLGRADLMLKKIEEKGIPLQPAWRNYLTDAQEKWQRELSIQRTESAADDLPRVKIETTEGDIVVELFENQAPQTVGNFISLVEKKFYDQLPFFRVRPGVSAETGCQFGNGTGDAGYKIPCECIGEEIRHHFSGTLSMSTTGQDTGSSQFFITHQRNPSFDGKYTAFGRVIEGMDVVYKLRMADGTREMGGEFSNIIQAQVLRKRDHPYVPTRVTAQNSDTNLGSAEDTDR